MAAPYLESDTIAAISTARGAGAIGIVRVSGPQALEFTAPLIQFTRHPSLYSLPSQQAATGKWVDQKKTIDHVIVTLFRAPHSYTGEDLVEISCHGSPAVLKKIMELILRQGARPAEKGEFSQRAFLNGKMDLTQAEAVANLIHSQTELSRSTALAQLEGGLSKTVSKIRENLIEVLAHIEVDLDHSDDPTVGTAMSKKTIQIYLNQTLSEIKRLVRSYDFGKLLTEGVHISIIGKPNVGKSSLLNRLVKSERAIVTSIPGTTRDTIEEGFDLFGLPALLIDTAGIREKASDVVEKIGIERTLKSIEKSDVVIVILDAAKPLSEEDQKAAELTRGKKKALVALNKCDLVPKLNTGDISQIFPARSVVSISALESTGIEELLIELYNLISAEYNLSSEENGSMNTSLRHKNCLTRCESGLNRALEICREEEPMEECLALEIREGLDALGEIAGTTVTEDVLNEIFSKFCIGK